MKESWIFDREKLLEVYKHKITSWCASSIETLNKHEGGDTIWQFESIYEHGRSLGIHLSSDITTEDTYGDNITGDVVVRTLRAGGKNRPKRILSLESDGDGIQSSIEIFKKIQDSFEGGDQHYLAEAIAHSSESHKNAREGYRIIAIDPIALRALNSINEIDFELKLKEIELRVSREQIRAPIHIQNERAGRYKTYLENNAFAESLLDHEIKLCVQKYGQKHTSPPMGSLEILQENDLLQVRTQKHSGGMLTFRFIEFERDLPESILHSLAGVDLDDVFVSGQTQGLGLKIKHAKKLTSINGQILSQLELDNADYKNLTFFKMEYKSD